jgi:hypothetical protein
MPTTRQDFLINDTTDEWKPMNAKGKRHHITCWHDEPGVTICTCGGCTCDDPPPHVSPCPRTPPWEPAISGEHDG